MPPGSWEVSEPSVVVSAYPFRFFSPLLWAMAVCTLVAIIPGEWFGLAFAPLGCLFSIGLALMVSVEKRVVITASQISIETLVWGKRFNICIVATDSFDRASSELSFPAARSLILTNTEGVQVLVARIGTDSFTEGVVEWINNRRHAHFADC